MNFKSHLAMSNILIENLQDQSDKRISKFFFKLGSLMPDISPVSRVKEHHISTSKPYVEKFIKKSKAFEIKGFHLSYLMGKTSHYLSDTFCAAHNEIVGMSLPNHYLYEKAIARTLKVIESDPLLNTLTKTKAFTQAMERCIVGYIVEKNENYLSEHDGSRHIDNIIHDITHTLIHSLHVLFAMMTGQPVPVDELFYGLS